MTLCEELLKEMALGYDEEIRKDWQEFEDDYFALDELINNKYTTK